MIGRILIVDDEPANVMLLERLLEHAGYTDVFSTNVSGNTFELVEKQAPDIILLDLHMPGMDGFQVLEQIAPLRAAAGLLPVLVLTADASMASRHRALAAGATDFLSKPFDAVEAILRIGNLLTMRRSQQHVENAVQERTAELRRALADLDKAQEQNVQTERLSALGAMTTGIAHDFNNSLALILGFGELLLIESQRDLRRPVVEKYARTIASAAEDAATVIRRLRDFHRPAGSGEMRQEIDLNQIVKEAGAFTQPRWENQTRGDGITLTMKTELAPLPALFGNAAELGELLTNLIFNAVDAMPHGGAITLRTLVRGDRVELQVADTGTGMSEEVRRRALEPFFTTKGEGGSGLGLAMVYGIVQRHGGQLDIESVPGTGTTFTISLPVTAGKAVTPPPNASEQPTSLRILLVDDKPVLSDIVAEFLTRDHHDVLSTTDAESALAAFDRQPFDLVITDRIMPGTCGDVLAIELKKRRPQIPIILLTGYYDASSEDGVLPGIDLILPKPATHQALRQAVATVMARPA